MLRTLYATLFLTATLAVPATAQIMWDSPALISPAVPSGFSIFLMSPEGGDLGGLGTFRHAAGPVGLGYRVGLAEDNGGDLAVSGGIDVSGFLARGVEGSEVDVVWWTGGGVGIGGETVFTAPLGIVLGWTGGDDDEVLLSPYGGAHAVLDLTSADGDSVHFDAVIDLGIDLVLASGWMIRVGASLGDRESFALGLKLPGGGGS